MLPLLQRLPIARLIVFRALHLGDMLCAVPALRALRQALPTAHLSLCGLPWAAQFAERFSDCIDAFLPFPGDPALPEQAVRTEALAAFYSQVQAQRYDLALQLHGDGAVSNHIVMRFGARHAAGFYPAAGRPTPNWEGLLYPQHGREPERLLRLAAQLGAAGRDASLAFPLYARDHAELAASGLAAGLRPGHYVCLHAGARSADKCWPPACFAAVADHVAARWSLPIVLTGAANETPLAEAVAARMRSPAQLATGPLSIGAMAALMAGSRLLVANDTGVSHIAAGLRLPSVIVFSKADMARWAPADAERHVCLWDPEGARTAAVQAAADQLLAAQARLV
ncbi:glycosyltransferase family 9 protein [Massilia sp. TS11]|uniref:glycosyltransferase family 9 protein n=1 Tax=Massilia sp. TS11 TaxID=2908003 RepID=UPI001EDBB964|nr:glycosyltransferase family 9 protein [Massilia sp. TS11]MCG2586855.1 glycosyltransferase family 9 protein [Massilia sp. TS11]